MNPMQRKREELRAQRRAREELELAARSRGDLWLVAGALLRNQTAHFYIVQAQPGAEQSLEWALAAHADKAATITLPPVIGEYATALGEVHAKFAGTTKTLTVGQIDPESEDYYGDQE